MKNLAIRLLSGQSLVDHPLLKRSRKWLPWVISLAAVGYIIWRVLQEDLSMWAIYWPPSAELMLGLLLVIALMPVNWGLEAVKWRVLIRTWYPQVSILTALELVFCGIATGIFTPNRIGEYPGRIMGLPSGYRWEAATVMAIDRLFQLILTLWTGIISLFLVGDLLPEAYQISPNQVGWITAGLLIGTGMLILGLQKMGKRVQWLPVKLKVALSIASPVKLLGIFILSAVRNLVFTGQFLVLLYASGLELPIGVSLGMVWLIFLLKSVVPVWTVTELGIRESIAIFVLGLAAVPVSIAFVPTFLLYLINLILPAIIGLRKVHRLSW